MFIGELSRRTGVSTRSLRYYEQQGLLRPQRRASGYREFDESDVATVRRVRILLAAGLNTDLIREVLPCMADEGAILAPTCEEMAQDLKDERERLGRSIEQLQAAHAMLGSIIHAGEPVTARAGCDG
ncbi:MerR family transcriptional regulator [Streptomyces caelestis]|jgi:DNA-binding transcriptional MerR regulator|uniref:DNA-binding transcriptional MerR regulator n=1 Tax=Streptomyces caelestis TaxID=36816 RepID=A0A7W9H5T0_9ACTN|nr:MerR family transcriptional regulator [Streptomyces caelestis]MBB5796202.1 DNA-binding transcriptional MerR regulator [Streptomyces caelestis]GGW42811.1 MerR family transcriptional regulator [Streptomyces caelestis]